MSTNPYLYEKLIAIRQAEIRHDMQLCRKPAHPERSPTFAEHAAGTFGTLLGELRSRLQRAEQQRRASIL